MPPGIRGVLFSNDDDNEDEMPELVQEGGARAGPAPPRGPIAFQIPGGRMERMHPMEAAMLQAVLGRSQVEAKPKEVVGNTFACAPKPKTMEEQPEAKDGQTACQICMVYRANHLMIPCGHLTMCAWCANEAKEKMDATCPNCRKPLDNFQVVYF
jgi:hypothetical protein